MTFSLDILVSKVSELRALKLSHDDTVKKIHSLMLSLKSDWGFDDGFKNYENTLTALTAFSQMLDDCTDLIDARMQDYKEKIDKIDESLAKLEKFN